MKTLRWLLLSVLAIMLALLAGLWVFSGSEGSLALAARAVTSVWPSAQPLTLQDVTGSLRHGGRIGQLHWQRGPLQVSAQDVTLRWSPQALLHGQLRLDELTIAALRIESDAPTRDGATTPPADLHLPITVDAHVTVASLVWAGSTTQTLEQLTFHYVFDSYQHSVNKGDSLFSSNKYSFSGSLQASDRMALALQLDGQVSAPVPAGAPQLLAAHVTLTGELASPAAELALQATLTPQQADNPMRATLAARLAPWAAQPIVSAQADWQQLDLALLWSQAPQTQLTGRAQVTQQKTGWHASAQLSNARSGPWNQRRLPVKTLQAELDYQGGRWLLQQLQAHGAGGSVDASGRLSAPATWQVRARPQGIDPAAIDTRLPAAALHGELTAQQALAAGGAAAPLTFDLDLQNRRGTVSIQPLQRLRAQGVWTRPTLDLRTLQIDAQDGALQGPLRVNTTSRAIQGRLDLRLPGLHAAWQGQLGPGDGQGTLSAQLTDAAQTRQWLARWPQLAPALNVPVSGDAALDMQWRGGWQNQLANMQVQADLRVKQWTWGSETGTSTGTDAGAPGRAAASVVQGAVGNTLGTTGRSVSALRDLRLKVAGSAAALTLDGTGEWVTPGLRWRGQTQGVATRQSGGAWQVRIDQAQAALHRPTDQGAGEDVWRVALQAASASPPLLRWQPSAQGGQWTLSPGSASLTGPAAGSASLRWQTLQWSAAGWQSSGQIEHLPLTWLDAVARRSMSDLGLRTDLLLSGPWQISKSNSLRASVTLERTSGDLFLQSADTASPIAADLHDAWLQVNLDDGQLAASLRWDSLRAGRALVAFSTQVRSASGAWVWGDDVPVAASVQLQLPPMDVWSALAPPGWRLRGTVDTHVDLTGTLRQPSWSGTIQARDLALRSLADGIDFRQGRLDATLHDQQLDLHAFTLRGAGKGDTDGGLLTLSGNVFWQPAAKPAALRQQLQMNLQAVLQELRLSSRADRRLSASGKLTAQLADGVVVLRGALRADHALFTLPDDSAPSLGDDVVVRRAGNAAVATPVKSTARANPGIDVAVDLDPGDDFQVRGRGMDTRLAGTLRLRARPGAAVQLDGSLQSVGGSYRAYGQTLAIERGVIRFTGAVDNPALDILALRPKLTQRVGVQISGTALSPIVTLYAEPDLPDAEKLAWLVLGRSASAGGAETALLQQAAMALLGGNRKGVSESLGVALGLDELSIRGSNASSDTAAGGVSGASVTLGKRLSGDFYVAYERSLNSAVGVFSIFYDLSKRLTLRAQTGEQSTVDLIYTMRYD